MAKKAPKEQQAIRESAEVRFAEELERLTKADANNPKPQGWLRSPRAVRQFILGDDTLGITPKFFGDDALVDRAIVTLLGKQGLMLVGEPGTAKSMLSELFAAAISGDSGLTIQGTAGTTEDHIKACYKVKLFVLKR